jgi:IS4 transposase
MLYRRRWEIETLFAALKSRGLGLEETHLTNPDRIQRLIGLLSLTFAWTHIIGENERCRKALLRLSLTDAGNGACFDMDWTCFKAC